MLWTFALFQDTQVPLSEHFGFVILALIAAHLGQDFQKPDHLVVLRPQSFQANSQNPLVGLFCLSILRLPTVVSTYIVKKIANLWIIRSYQLLKDGHGSHVQRSSLSEPLLLTVRPT